MAVSLGYSNVYRDPHGYPQWDAKGLPVNSAPAGLSDTAPKTNTEKSFQGWAILWTLLGIFVGGMALNLTPCVYPLIPITVSYFGGRSGQGRGWLAAHGACYIGGLAVTNSILGVVAALTGGLMGAMLMIKVDLTRRGNPDYERLLQQYDVKGVPTVVFIGRRGRERQDLRLVDFLPAEQFLVRMAEAGKTK